jgi:GR25 family glycosyltransferase involved in LPS biosynthesis
MFSHLFLVFLLPLTVALDVFLYPSPREWPAWVITLARTPARLQRFKRSSAAFSEFPRLLEFPATDGRTLEVVTEARLSSRARVRTRDVSGRRAHSDLQTLGMAGLYVSHVNVWKAFLDSGEPLGLVLEDDAVVPVGAGARIEAALAGMPPPDAWDVWLVGALALRATGGQPPGLPPGWVSVTDWWGTQAYVVTRRGAAALLAHAYPADAQIDAYMAQMAALGEVLALSRQPLDVDIPQFAWYTLGGTTVQCVGGREPQDDHPLSFGAGPPFSHKNTTPSTGNTKFGATRATFQKTLCWRTKSAGCATWGWQWAPSRARRSSRCGRRSSRLRSAPRSAAAAAAGGPTQGARSPQAHYNLFSKLTPPTNPQKQSQKNPSKSASVSTSPPPPPPAEAEAAPPPPPPSATPVPSAPPFAASHSGSSW